MKTYKENQDLHSNLIEERASNNSKGYRGSVLMSNTEAQHFTGMNSKGTDDAGKSKKTNGSSNDENVLTLKVNQLENQIKHITEEKLILEKELASK